MKTQTLKTGKMKQNCFIGAAAVILLFAAAASLAEAGNVIVKNGQLNASSYVSGSDTANFAYNIFMNQADGGVWLDTYNNFNNGIYRNASGSVFIRANGADTLAVGYGGNVGIGTTNPKDKLHVYQGNIRLDVPDSSVQSIVGWEAGDSPHMGIDFNYAGTGDANSLQISNWYSTYPTRIPLVTFQRGGNVGIGTTSPSAKLEIQGALGGAKGQIYINSTGNNDHAYLSLDAPAGRESAVNFYKAGIQKWTLYSPVSSNDLRLYDTTDRLTFQAGGNVGIGTTSPSEKLNVNGSLRVDNSTGSAVLYVNASNGNVGIGTASPAATLDVNGNVKLDGSAVANSSNEIYFADNGQIRSTDDNHRIVFNRSGNQLDLREYGDIYLSAGATAGVGTGKLVVKSTGFVGINKTNPAALLDVNGPIYQRGAQIHADVAEDYPAVGVVKAGDVVSFAGNGSVEEAGAGESVAGVISEDPGYRIRGEEGWVPVALTGRVWVRFVGSVSPGDYVFSVGDGKASGGAISLDNLKLVVGKALESKDCANECRLMVMVGRM